MNGCVILVVRRMFDWMIHRVLHWMSPSATHWVMTLTIRSIRHGVIDYTVNRISPWVINWVWVLGSSAEWFLEWLVEYLIDWVIGWVLERSIECFIQPILEMCFQCLFESRTVRTLEWLLEWMWAMIRFCSWKMQLVSPCVLRDSLRNCWLNDKWCIQWALQWLTEWLFAG